MYLSELKLWNFRKYGIEGEDFEKSQPGLSLPFQPGLNVLIGENDSGKTAITDAIRYVVGTQSGERLRLVESDFHGQGTSRAASLKIQCTFRGFTHAEAGPFLEWLGFEEIDGRKEYVLNVRLTAHRKDPIVARLRAGSDETGTSIDSEARTRLSVTYLKPLRNAENELTAGRRSRFAQILRAHRSFQRTVVHGQEQPHELEEIINTANESIDDYFNLGEDETDEEKAGALLQKINDYLEEFLAKGDDRSARIEIAGSDLLNVLQRLELVLEENPAGLGSLNLLYIAAELLLLQGDEFHGLRLAVIEELEAHLHPQAQIRIINFLTHASDSGQYLLTTHSTMLGASIDLKKLAICRGENVYQMGPEFTKLAPKNYEFLQRFLNSTKANLFFARGVLLVEGDAENLLIPAIAEVIDRPLYRYGVSVVNVGSTAFSHYERIFLRRDGSSMGIKVAVVTDLDVKPLEWYSLDSEARNEEDIEKKKVDRRTVLAEGYGDLNIRRSVSPNWTLEYEIALSDLRASFYEAVLWAEKKQNARTGTPKEGKKKEVSNKARTDLVRWESEAGTRPRAREEIAWKIYKETLLDKEISKAITAQEFAARLIAGKDRFRNRLLKTKRLEYIVEAICHVTESLQKGIDDENRGS